MKTVVVNTKSIAREWFVVDASSKVLGRLATQVGQLLMGKGKPAYSPNQDHGDNIIVINTDKVKITGKKFEDKSYFRHSKHPGGGKFRSFGTQMDLDSTQVVITAIRRMVPRTALGRSMMRKLHAYTDANHPHAGQNPKVLEVK